MSAVNAARDSGPRVQSWLKLLPEIVVLGLCVVLWTSTFEFASSVGGPGPALYPRVLIGLLALSMIIRLAQQVREIRRGQADVEMGHDTDSIPEEGAELDASLIDNRRLFVIVALSVGYVVATIYLGWVIATFLFTIVFLVLAGKRNALVILPLALIFSVGLAYVFVKIVYISLPTGVGPFDAATVFLFELLGAY